MSKTALITAITFILPSILLNVETAQGKDNSPVPKIKLRVQITGTSGERPGGTMGAFGSDQLVEFAECAGVERSSTRATKLRLIWPAIRDQQFVFSNSNQRTAGQFQKYQKLTREQCARAIEAGNNYD